MARMSTANLSGTNGTHIGGTSDDGTKVWPTSIEGYYVDRRQKTNQYNPDKSSYHYVLITPEGEKVVYGRAYLDVEMRKIKPDGRYVWIEAAGLAKKEPGKKPAYLYEVNYDPTNCYDMAAYENPEAAAVALGTSPSPYIDPQDASNDETGIDDDVTPPDEVAPAYLSAPKTSVATASAASQARTKALLGANKTSARK